MRFLQSRGASCQSEREAGGNDVVCRPGGWQVEEGSEKALWEEKGNFAEFDNEWQGDFVGV